MTLDKLVVIHVDIYNDYHAFLESIVSEVEQWLSCSSGDGLALNWVHKNIGGVGVYLSVCYALLLVSTSIY